ncbi:LysR family transcriptional regulator [Brasilonema octagenarum UFV-E1]|uniref:LysR family transcriptional regulator n=2 Tax=Brasilonema TaxID=383614 RepID=A0A856MGM7_9CYAN|nr:MULTISPECIES: LysR family transcriptional regulator [Brasilonema]NMF65659.1 LysR family transcriptional regulator [Brasilonema octagenarum UFV-OR1]QDL08831.1 LysR family transcriptional regulator [Brasilonema sennae CENA114]QDL15188.1 LysR family transcriptional regulator [Brasilonema octagenarum UFV-E1]
MELRHLRYFVAVAEELHFGRAAERLHMTQQPLSQQIRQLEDELGVLLFERTKRRVQLTEPGKAFLVEARHILLKATEAVEIVRQVAQGESGRLKVGFSGFATYSVLPKALRIFRERFPRVELELEEMTTSAQVQALQEQQIHLGLMIPPTPDASLTLEPILKEPLVVILPETHPLATQPELALPMLANESFILVSRQLEPGYYDQCISLFQQAGFSPKVVQKASQKQTILGLVSAGMGVSLAPASIRNIHRTGVVYITLNLSDAEVELVAVWRQDESLPVLRTFLEVMKEVVDQNFSPIL